MRCAQWSKLQQISASRERQVSFPPNLFLNNHKFYLLIGRLLELMSISVNKAFIKKDKLLKELALKTTITTTKMYSNHVKTQGVTLTNISECRLIRKTIEGNWMKFCC